MNWWNNESGTFEEEGESLQGIPGIFGDPPKDDNEDPFCPVGELPEITSDRESEEYGSVAPPRFPQDSLDIGLGGHVALPIDIPGVGQDAGKLEEHIAGSLGIDIEEVVESIASGRPDGDSPLDPIKPRFGVHVFGTYLPWHFYRSHPFRHWGMYLFLEPLLYRAADLIAIARTLPIRLSPTEAFFLGFYATYRHEQFHYHVERFATRQEVIQRHPVYLPYDANVYSNPAIANSEKWLEEALAQAVVIRSRHLGNKVLRPLREMKPILEKEFATFGPGYRDYDCPTFGGVERAHRVLGAQLASGRVYPGFEVTEFATPKKEYQAPMKEVPGFLVICPSFVSRFQLARPKKRKWTKYAKRNGFVFQKGKGPGDHEEWKRGAQKVQINPVGDEIDLASVKAVARILGRSTRDVALDIARC
jgi:hypothetical protein